MNTEELKNSQEQEATEQQIKENMDMLNNNRNNDSLINTPYQQGIVKDHVPESNTEECKDGACKIK